MYVDNEKIAASLIGSYTHNIGNKNSLVHSSYGYGIGFSFLKSFDLGILSYKAENIKESTVITNFDVHLRNKHFTLVINSAYSNSAGESKIFLGLSIYRRFNLFYESLNIYPTLSGGIILNSGGVIGFGIPFENKINEHFSIILTPGFNVSADTNQLVLGLEFLIK